MARLIRSTAIECMDNSYSKFLMETFIEKYDLKIFTCCSVAEKILELSEKESIDVFILFFNNIVFHAARSIQDRLEKALNLIVQIKAKYQKPVVVISGLDGSSPYSAIIARAERAADFFFFAPCMLDDLKIAIEKCVDMCIMSKSSELSIGK